MNFKKKIKIQSTHQKKIQSNKTLTEYYLLISAIENEK